MQIQSSLDKFSFLKLFSFISSMFPLSIYLLLTYYNDNYAIGGIKYFTPKVVSALILLCEIISIVYVIFFYFHLLKKISKTKGREVEIKNPVQEKTSTSNYLLANILPIITLDYNKTPIVILTIFLIITLCFMYIKNNLYYINPIYDIFNIKVYTCDIKFPGGTEKKPIVKRKTVISINNLYDFERTKFLIVEDVDIVFVVNECTN